MNGKTIIAALVVLLLVVHQDNWLWNDQTLVFGFMPSGLLFHAGISIAAGATWFLATKIAWPDHLEQTPGEDVDVSPLKK